MASRRHYVLTNHVRERFIQRDNKKFDHLNHCYKKFCATCDELIKKIHNEIIYNVCSLDEKIYARLDLSEEDRSHINNTNFMNWYYEKYGYERKFELLIHENIAFIVIFDKDKKIVVTCIKSKTYFAGKQHLKRPKFNKISKKTNV